MIQVTGLDHINISTHNYQKTLDFYKNHFGFQTKEKGIKDGRAFEIIGLKNKIYLALYDTGKEQDGALSRFTQEKGLNHFGLHVQNFDETYQYAQDHDIKITIEPYQYPNSRSFYVEDPNGMEIEISEVFGGGLN